MDDTTLNWHTLEQEEVLGTLGVQARVGLDVRTVAERQARFGKNRLPDPPRVPAWRLFLSQFQDVLVLVLLGATVISGFLGEVGDAVTILAIVVMNAILGYLQESRAEHALQALKALASPVARVVREGRILRLPAEDLVPGDVVSIEAGDRLPADMRLLEATALEVEESALTGESVTVSKHSARLQDLHLGPADQTNMAFMGTAATRGRATGVVVATGLATQMGRIASLLAESESDKTPLEHRLSALSTLLVMAVLGVCVAVVAVAVLRGEPLYRMFLTGVSLGVAAIPEGLPAIVTVALALGVQRMVKRRAIVRRLPAVEALGCATVVGSDKTGTLTRNEMTVRLLWTDGRAFALGGEGYGAQGALSEVEAPVVGAAVERPAARAGLTACTYLAHAAAVCCDAGVAAPEGTASAGALEVDGDPTEIALLVAAVKLGIAPGSIGRLARRLGEVPFDADMRRMAVLVPTREGARSVVKGAPDIVMSRTTRLRQADGSVRALTGEDRTRIRHAVDTMASGALRVLAVAERPALAANAPASRWQEDLVFLGLVGMMDPPRPEAARAVAQCHAAGIRVLMITGDHPETAAAVGRELGILPVDGRVVTGRELDRWDDARLAREAADLRVLARVTPRHKLRVVRALKRAGEVVAMTGDGVNDAPAVKEADVGIAMGVAGTDVTKEAAAIVLGDDNFATIVAAIEEGRSIYDNVRKFIRYLLACNTGEVLTMFGAAVLGAPMPLLPIQILWVNLVTDGLPALALGLEPADPDTMERPPRSPRESVFAHGLGLMIGVRGAVIGAFTLALFLVALRTGHSLAYARTVAFAALTLQQLVFVFECRSEHGRPWALPVRTNPWLPLAVLSSLGLFATTLYVPQLRPVFQTVPLDGQGWLWVAAASLVPSLIPFGRRSRAQGGTAARP